MILMSVISPLKIVACAKAPVPPIGTPYPSFLEIVKMVTLKEG